MELLKTPKASAYLAEKGVKRSPNTLAKLRTIGGGPTFMKFGAEVYYAPTALDRWVEGRLSRPVSSTSQLPDRAA
ncbi:hypothetical protein [Mesorhizobium sp.]|uniref:hypothetical protein n=1 Tax=Mesorhizobium sp. TaxID=1871066 RepID=UPI000FE50A9A|nr:hypothetical protein [Mesorhizobium sp.]RWP64144.1 MAG: hypothetical protein EOR07_16285 [Mesorhizobium sp.]